MAYSCIIDQIFLNVNLIIKKSQELCIEDTHNCYIFLPFYFAQTFTYSKLKILNIQKHIRGTAESLDVGICRYELT